MDISPSGALLLAVPAAAGAFFTLSAAALSRPRQGRLSPRFRRVPPAAAPSGADGGPVPSGGPAGYTDGGGVFAERGLRRDSPQARNTDGGPVPAGGLPQAYLFGLRLLSLAAQLAAGCAGYRQFRAPFPFIAWAAALVLCTGIVPEFIAARNTEAAFRLVFPAVSILCAPFLPLFALLSRLARPRRAGAPASDITEREKEFRVALEEGERSGAVESGERSMVEGVLYLGGRTAGAFMAHRSEIQCLNIGCGPEEGREKALAYRAQFWFPVVGATRDDVAGVVSVQDILIALTETPAAGGAGGSFLRPLMKKPRFIPETMSALKAFAAFGRTEEQILCVMDEYGGFAGILRPDDLIEEITGELTGAAEEQALRKEADGSWIADGLASADEAAAALGLESLGKRDGSYHTLAGFILKLAGDIPRPGDSFVWDGWRFTVLKREGNRVGSVLIKKLPPEE